MKDKTKLLIIISLVLNCLIIAALLYTKLMADTRLKRMSGMMQRLGSAVIDYTVHVEDTLEINTAFNIEQTVPVLVQMNVKYDLPFKP